MCNLRLNDNQHFVQQYFLKFFIYNADVDCFNYILQTVEYQIANAVMSALLMIVYLFNVYNIKGFTRSVKCA